MISNRTTSRPLSRASAKDAAGSVTPRLQRPFPPGNASAVTTPGMRRFLIVASSLLASAAVLSACGSSGSNPATVDAAGNSGSGNSAQAIAFSRCMRANGVPNFPDSPGGGIRIQKSDSSGSGPSLSINGVPVNAPAFQHAMSKCQRYAPQGGSLTPQQVARIRANALAMARCMRTHGVPNFPDPIVTTGPGGHGIGIRIGGPGSGLDPSSPAFQAASK